MNSLNRTLLHAILSYDPSNDEEQGGFILRVPNTKEYEFVPVKNGNTGTPIAYGLYTADTVEFNKNVAERSMLDDLDIFASFHTHPKGMRALPSSIDMTQLFTSFPVNFIYAHDRELNRFDYDTKDKEMLLRGQWIYNNVMTFNRFVPQLRAADKRELEPCRDE